MSLLAAPSALGTIVWSWYLEACNITYQALYEEMTAHVSAVAQRLAVQVTLSDVLVFSITFVVVLLSLKYRHERRLGHKDMQVKQPAIKVTSEDTQDAKNEDHLVAVTFQQEQDYVCLKTESKRAPMEGMAAPSASDHVDHAVMRTSPTISAITIQTDEKSDRNKMFAEGKSLVPCATDEDISMTLPDTRSYSAIVDQSLPNLDVSGLTATTSTVLGDHSQETETFAQEALRRVPADVATRTPERSGATPEDAIIVGDVQFTLTVTEAPVDKLLPSTPQTRHSMSLVPPSSKAAQTLRVESSSNTAAVTPGRGRGPSFIRSQESPASEPLSSQTNVNAGRITRSKSKTRLHTNTDPDWAVAPDESSPNKPITRSVSARSLKTRNMQSRKKSGMQSTGSSVDEQGALVASSSRIVEVNGKWARGSWKGRGRGRGRA